MVRVRPGALFFAVLIGACSGGVRHGETGGTETRPIASPGKPSWSFDTGG